MAFDKDAFLTALDSMTVLELNDLVKAIEEKFGVSAAAMAAPAAGGAAGGAAAAEEKTEFNVVLTGAGANNSAALVAAFVEDLVETARRMAARSPGARLDPPLLLALDEIGNLAARSTTCAWTLVRARMTK